jgi:hypothetical protein
MTLRMLAGVALAATLGWSGPASADPIAITSGSLEVFLFGPASHVPSVLVLAGDRGFTMNAIAGQGIFGPGRDCHPDGCQPGQTIDLSASWSGLDITGMATLDGITYEHFGAASDDAVAIVNFAASFILPMDAGATVDITAPFLFTGFFVHGQTGPEIFRELLLGSGIVSTRFRRAENVFGRVGYVPEHTLYTFGGASTVPEPATWLLLGTGMGALALTARRRTRRSP